MRIGIDLDGTFCTDRYEAGGVVHCELMEGAKEKILEMRSAGHEVIFFTHRGYALAADTERWMKNNEVKYDNIIFGKPHFDLYIGNEAIKFQSWDEVEVP